ncbi:MAG TPA: AAA family ATPase [Prolixibacteraceae bacterium]|nr:MAG: ATP-dependent RecD-like DNA helicase [Bacteroidetes bacterium ADurb.Bin123]HNU76748.1 AAA family ATPase [Prolixibacteraceae bacterium]HPV18916.1 AAA family ATPase [Prolixibacteraceae bacterium]
MLKNHIVGLLSSNAGFHFTESQAELVDKLAGYILSSEADKLFLIRGFAGTGKTTMIHQLALTLDSLRIKSVLLAPTGRAAKVLSGYTGKSAYTIHKKIYRQKSSGDGMGTFVLDKNLHRYTWFIVDESSMISNEAAENSVFGSGKLLDDLMEYVFSGEGCRLVLAGDTAQLPPVGIPVSPALDPQVLEDHGFGVIGCELTDVVRQEKESAVLANATMIRERIFSNDNSGFFAISVPPAGDLERISGGELMEKLSLAYEKMGIAGTIVLTRSNKRANLYNKGIRTSILFRDTVISRGDLLMVVKNNYFWINEEMGIGFIANGDIGEITHIYGYEELYGFRFANITLRLSDYGEVETDCKILLDTLDVEAPALTRDDQIRLFNAVSEDYADIRNKRERWKKIKGDPYFNALQVKFAYAVTCHKAQGGQWPAVFVDTGFLTEEMIDREFLRWLYTAITRSTEKLFLVNFNNRFFGEEK